MSTALLVLPVIFCATRGTSVSVCDTLFTIIPPSVSMIIAAGVSLVARGFIHSWSLPLLRLTVCNVLFFGSYAIVLLFAMGQKPVYFGLLEDIGLWPLAGSRKKVESR